MTLRRQLLLVSLLTLLLPWAGCQFVRETESALREGQQNNLGGTAQAIADSLSQFPTEFFESGTDGAFDESQVYAHGLGVEPLIDGYTDDWTVPEGAERLLEGEDGDIRLLAGRFQSQLFLALDVRDASPTYANAGDLSVADRIEVDTEFGDGRRERYVFAAEAPGLLIGRRVAADGLVDENRLRAVWLNRPGGYRIEARLPLELVGRRLGVMVINERNDGAALRSATFSGERPGFLVTPSPVLTSVIRGYARPDLRLIVTDKAGWRLAVAGNPVGGEQTSARAGSGWLRMAYELLLEPGQEARFAEPDPTGRERQPYLETALEGDTESAWFRSAATGRSVVAVAQPVWAGTVQTGTVVLQQGTAEVLSLTNEALGRLANFTLIATAAVALGLIGYASLLSLRIRRLSQAAERSIDTDPARIELPSAGARDEIGDLSRSFGQVLKQLGNYNEYLRTLASKLSHELRTPLTIVSSSLENLEHEPLSEEAARYTARAKDGAARLKKILDAMSEANRVEELMESAEPERFDLRPVVASATEAYAQAFPKRHISFAALVDSAPFEGSPELLIQLLDKLIDNAVGFTGEGDAIVVGLDEQGAEYRLSVFNPGPPLPEKMRHRLFDSMISMRSEEAGKHLGLGLYIARLIAEGHGGTITAENFDDGVRFTVLLPVQKSMG